MIRETPQEFLDILKSYVPDPNRPVGLARQEFSEFLTEFQSDERPETEAVAIREDLRGVWCSVAGGVPDRTLLFFHGGFFSVGSTADHLGFCAELARATRSRVFSVDYRLAPEHPFPAAAEDALEAYRFLAKHGYPPHRIIPVGISAGGTLVIDLLLSLREQHLLMPPAAVCLSPVVDLSSGRDIAKKGRESDWLTLARLAAIRTQYLAYSDPEDPRASPVHANLSGLPRLYIQAGSGELMYDDISAFAGKAKWAGVQVRFEIWEGMFHFWQIFGKQVPEARDALARVGIFARETFER
ncbi:alpha/beta hydrolase [Methanoregula sp.]|uniref:alpha/beta hydrolase n=1 Tax=Methanoregula sp. TaxID=2052170 RepID=UPI002CB0A945|nr:alpha/beta hydrolase [Methanoregula sp.]HVP96206.1 alpha/beta hydrolase [Methanoregula sp.]